MARKDSSNFRSDIKELIKDLSGPDYITNTYSDIGITSLIVLSTVFRPDKSYLGKYLAKFLNDNDYIYKNKTVLDLGCGCGALGIICLLKGAKKIHFSDINPIAVKNSKLNTMLMDLDNVSFSCGSLFNGLSKNSKFDLIIFNSPAVSGLPSNTTESAFIREDITMLRFYETFPKYLNKNGFVIMPGSTRFSKQTEPLNLTKRYNYKTHILNKEREEKNYKYTILIKNPFLD